MRRLHDMVLIDSGEYDEASGRFDLKNNVRLSQSKAYYVEIIDDGDYTLGQLIIFPPTEGDSASVFFGRGTYDDMPAFTAGIIAYKDQESHGAAQQYSLASDGLNANWAIKVYEVA